MKDRSQILSYLCIWMSCILALPMFGQQEVAFQLGGEAYRVFYNLSSRENSLIQIKDDNVIINANEFDPALRGKQHFVISIIVVAEHGDNIKIRPDYPKGHLAILSNDLNPLGGQIVYSVTRADIPPVLSLRRIKLEIVDATDGSIVADPLVIKLNFNTPTPPLDLSLCEDESDPIARLTCLEQLIQQATAEGVIIPATIRREIQRLKTAEVRRLLEDGFILESNRITCLGCDFDRFAFEVTPFQLVEKKGEEWILTATTTTTYTITSLEFPNLSATLLYEVDTPVAREVRKKEVLEVRNNDNATPKELERSNTEERIDKLTANPKDTLSILPQEAKTFWNETIKPQLSLMAIVNPGFKLSQDLNQYLNQKPINGVHASIAYLILYRLWIIIPLLLALLLIRFALRIPNGQSHLPESNIEDLQPIVVDPFSEPIEPAYYNAAVEEAVEIDILEVTENGVGAVSKPSLEEVEENTAYLPIILNKCWQNTAVTTVHMHKNSIWDIHTTLQKYNTLSKDRATLEDIPEIGGFILGNVYPKGEQEYQVSIENFVPITAESQNRYTVKFGNQAWVELDDALNANPGKKLVGWFHTHPGHGLFLSNADLREHQQLFQEPYQFALEIDPLTPNLDMALFTWTKDKRLNNREDRLMDQWWSFNDFKNRAV